MTLRNAGLKLTLNHGRMLHGLSYKKTWGLGSNKSSEVRVVDYYVKEPVTIDQVLLSDGSIMDLDAYEEVSDELLERDVEYVDAKKVETFKVMHYKMSGAEVLEQPVEGA